MKSSKLSFVQGQSWENLKLDLKQIVMKERKTEEKMLTQEKWEYGEEKVEDQRVEDNQPSDKGQRHQVFAVAERVWSQSEKVLWEGRVQAQQIKNSWMVGKTLVLKLLWEAEVWRNQERCGDFSWKTSGEMQKEKGTYSLRMKLWMSQTSQQPEGAIF